MRVVLDTNVLVSGQLSPNGPPGQITTLLLAGRMTPLYDERIADEYHRILRRSEFPFLKRDVDLLLLHIFTAGEFIMAEPLPIELPDRADEMFLEVAISGSADHLVTGNLRHFPARNRCGVSVLAPAPFLELFRRGTG